MSELAEGGRHCVGANGRPHATSSSSLGGWQLALLRSAGGDALQAGGSDEGLTAAARYASF